MSTEIMFKCVTIITHVVEPSPVLPYIPTFIVNFNKHCNTAKVLVSCRGLGQMLD